MSEFILALLLPSVLLFVNNFAAFYNEIDFLNKLGYIFSSGAIA
jgi:hypothetical protein